MIDPQKMLCELINTSLLGFLYFYRTTLNLNRFLVPGEYKIQARYHYMFMDTTNKKLVENEYFSNIETFTIKNPVDSIDIAAINAKNKMDYKDKRDAKFLKEFIENYKGSNYVNEKYWDLLSVLYEDITNKRAIDYQELNRQLENMIITHPNSFHTLRNLYYRGNKEELLNKPSIKQKIINSKFEKYYKKVME